MRISPVYTYSNYHAPAFKKSLETQKKESNQSFLLSAGKGIALGTLLASIPILGTKLGDSYTEAGIKEASLYHIENLTEEPNKLFGPRNYSDNIGVSSEFQTPDYAAYSIKENGKNESVSSINFKDVKIKETKNITANGIIAEGKITNYNSKYPFKTADYAITYDKTGEDPKYLELVIDSKERYSMDFEEKKPKFRNAVGSPVDFRETALWDCISDNGGIVLSALFSILFLSFAGAKND